jgi:SNF2 family DNA or RNA helicase
MFKLDADFYIINFEATFRFLKQIVKLAPDIVIYDESSRISNPQTKQTKACIEIGGHAKYRLLLNGTPIANKPLDLWSQMYCLDFGDTLGSNFKSYRRAFFATIRMRNSSGKYFSIYRVRNKAAMDTISKRLASKSIRYTKEECIKDLPEKLYQVRTLELSKGSRQLYDEMYDNAKLEITKLGQNISAFIMLTKFVKAIQITSGYLKTDEGNYLKLKTNPKLAELQGLIEEIVPDDAIVIWCKYLFSISLIEKLLRDMGLNYLVIRGDVEDKSAVAETFQNSSIEDIPILIGQIRSGGVGLNLHKASYEIFYENEWRLLDREQAEDRCHRIGSKKNVTIIDLLMKNTIDEQIVRAIKQKKEVADYIISKLE